MKTYTYIHPNMPTTSVHCFTINGVKLYNDVIFIEIDHIPYLFTCYEEDNIAQKYLVQRVYESKQYDIYYIYKLNHHDYTELVFNLTPVRDVILKNDTYIEVHAFNDNIAQDKYTTKPISSIDMSVLPKNGAYLTIVES